MPRKSAEPASGRPSSDDPAFLKRFTIAQTKLASEPKPFPSANKLRRYSISVTDLICPAGLYRWTLFFDSL